MASTTDSKQPGSHSLLALIIPYVVILALQYDIAKDGLNYSSPFPFMLMRYLVAAVALFASARNFRPIVNRDTILLSTFTALSTVLWILGLQNIEFSQSAVLSFTFPLFSIPLSSLILGEKARRMVWAGATVGFLGTIVYGIPLYSTGPTAISALSSIGGAVFSALFAVYARKVRLLESARVAGTQFLLGSPILLLLVPFGVGTDPTLPFVFDLLYVSLNSGAILFYLWFAMSKVETVGRLTVLTFSVPIVTVVAQFVQTGYVPTSASAVGIVLIFSGIFLSRRDK